MREVMMINQFSLKYRPRVWEDVFGQDSIVQALRKRVLEDNFPKATLFVGPFGTGKTTMAEMLACCMQSHLEDGNPDWESNAGKSILSGRFDRDTQRLDGSQLSGKTDMVEFTSNLNVRPLYDKKKIMIVEEVDQLSGAAFNSLLKILEDSSPHVHFILLSMDDKKGVPAAIKSRCQVFNVKSVKVSDTMRYFKNVLEKEGLWGIESIPREFFLEGLKTIATLSGGSMRSAVQNLEKCLMNEAYTVEAIEELIAEVGEYKTWKILDGLLAKSKEDELWRTIMNYKGDDIMHLYNYMVMLLSEAILYKETGFVYTEANEARLSRMSQEPNVESLYYTLSLHPQMTKPFLRNSDLIGALVAYYQDKEVLSDSKKIKIGTTEVPSFLKVEETTPLTQKTPEIRVRTRKVPNELPY